MSKTTIPESVKRDLWFAAHGRCEFAGCNKVLFKHGITMDECNISNYAHIIGDSPKGPRGDKEKSKELAKDINNYCCPIKPLYTAISSLNPAEIGMISSYFKFQAPH